MNAIVPYRMLVAGDWVEAADGRRLDSLNPATGAAWASFPAASAADVDRAVRAAHRAMTEGPWSRTNTYRAVSPMAPFGGYKSSGFGREAGQESLLDYTRTKTVWINSSTAPLGDPFVMR